METGRKEVVEVGWKIFFLEGEGVLVSEEMKRGGWWLVRVLEKKNPEFILP